MSTLGWAALAIGVAVAAYMLLRPSAGAALPGALPALPDMGAAGGTPGAKPESPTPHFNFTFGL